MMKRQLYKKTHWFRQWIFLMAVVIVPVALYGQAADSLENILATQELTNEKKIRIYKELAWDCINDLPDRCIYFSTQGIILAKELGDQKKEATFAYYLGASYYAKMVHDSAAFYLDESLMLAQKINDNDRKVSALKMYGHLYRRQGLYDKALERYHEAMKVAEQLEDDYQLGIVYMGIGGTYHFMRNERQALSYYEKAEEIISKHQDKQGLGDLYFSLSSVYQHQEGGKDKAIDYAKKSLEIHKESDSPFNEINALQTLSSAYFYYDDFTNAMKYGEEALRLSKANGRASLIADAYINISAISYYQDQYEKSAEAALAALENDSISYHSKLPAFYNLTTSYARLGEFDSMENYLDRFKETIESYSNQTYQKSISEMEVKYETEKKELKIAALEKQRQLYVWLGVAGAVILLIALAFAFIRYRLAVSRRKLAEEEAQRLEQEKQLVAVQATLDGETAERTRLAKDLHDGLGSMLSLVKFNLPQVKGDAVIEAVDVSRFQKALGMLDDSIQELRRVAHHMMPESLLRYGLKVSLSDFCAAIPTADFHYFGDETRLPDKLEIMVYRCIHELVNNALKHAEATHINVQLVQEADRISFTVQDDGIGFDQKQVTEGMGLQNVRQRVATFQGEISIYSSATGTEIHVEIKI